MLGDRPGQDRLHGAPGAGQVVLVDFAEEALDGIRRRAVVGPFVGHIDDAPLGDFVRHALDAGLLGAGRQDWPHEAQGDERVAPEIRQEIPGAGEEFFPEGKEFEVAERLREKRVLPLQFPAAFVDELVEGQGREPFEIGGRADGQPERLGGRRIPPGNAEDAVRRADDGGGSADELQPVAVVAVPRPSGESDLAGQRVRQRAEGDPAIGQVLQGHFQPGFKRRDSSGPEQVPQSGFILVFGIDAEPRHQRVVQEYGGNRNGDLRRWRFQGEGDSALSVVFREGGHLAGQRPTRGPGGLEAQGGFAGRHGDHHPAGPVADGDLNVRRDLGFDLPHQDVVEVAFQLSDQPCAHRVIRFPCIGPFYLAGCAYPHLNGWGGDDGAGI